MKKIAALMVLALMAALASAQPAMAGVGGCKTLVCGGGWNLSVSGSQQSKAPAVLDSLHAALPADVVAFLKAMVEQKNDTPTVVQQPQAPTIAGVGGCGARFCPGL